MYNLGVLLPDPFCLPGWRTFAGFNTHPISLPLQHFAKWGYWHWCVLSIYYLPVLLLSVIVLFIILLIILIAFEVHTMTCVRSFSPLNYCIKHKEHDWTKLGTGLYLIKCGWQSGVDKMFIIIIYHSEERKIFQVKHRGCKMCCRIEAELYFGQSHYIIMYYDLSDRY